MTAPLLTPLFIVRESGALEELGSWNSERRELQLVREGFPFLGRGRHVLESALPWLFTDMAPSGYLGAKFAQAFPELGLPTRTAHWSDAHVLRAISQRGEDLGGNIIVGEESRRRYVEEFLPALKSGDRKQSDYRQVITEFLATAAGAGSSLGGERPKVALHSVGESKRDMLLKFTPPVSSELGRRWANLYVLESLAARTLSQFGVSAVGSHPGTFRWLDVAESQRGGLLLPRFDRSTQFGRIGSGSLYWLHASRGGDLSEHAPAVMESLAKDGLVSADDVETVRTVHAFSAALGNNDAHLGNYGLLFDEAGRARLAPIYDVTAMVFAPVADELPDARVTKRGTPVDPKVQPMLDRLIALVKESPDIDDAFKTLWLRYVS